VRYELQRILQMETTSTCRPIPVREEESALPTPSLAMIVITLCGVAVFDLMFLERQVHEGVAVSDLNNAVLEMRRQEKNLFRYGKPTP